MTVLTITNLLLLLLAGVLSAAEGDDVRKAFEAVSGQSAWRSSPVVVGGTGGSGTRGVVEKLIALGVYMKPRQQLLLKKCYNGAPIDNSCMHPRVTKVTDVVPSSKYLSFLRGELHNASCAIDTPLRPTADGQLYIDSVPRQHRVPHRWGWKTPKNSYQLHLLLSLYPNLIFIQTVRNPLDMSSDVLGHLANRAFEFSDVHGGFASAARLFKSRCEGKSKRSKKPAYCVLPPAALKATAECNTHLKPHQDKVPIGKCAVSHGVTNLSPYRCMLMQLWAELNHAMHAFGAHCLGRERFLVYHAEDNYGLRGAPKQQRLKEALSGASSLPVPLSHPIRFPVASSCCHSHSLHEMSCARTQAS